jgi:hypothetical protein
MFEAHCPACGASAGLARTCLSEIVCKGCGAALQPKRRLIFGMAILNLAAQAAGLMGIGTSWARPLRYVAVVSGVALLMALLAPGRLRLKESSISSMPSIKP